MILSLCRTLPWVTWWIPKKLLSSLGDGFGLICRTVKPNKNRARWRRRVLPTRNAGAEQIHTQIACWSNKYYRNTCGCLVVMNYNSDERSVAFCDYSAQENRCLAGAPQAQQILTPVPPDRHLRRGRSAQGPWPRGRGEGQRGTEIRSGAPQDPSPAARGHLSRPPLSCSLPPPIRGHSCAPTSLPGVTEHRRGASAAARSINESFLTRCRRGGCLPERLRGDTPTPTVHLLHQVRVGDRWQPGRSGPNIPPAPNTVPLVEK